MSSNISGNRSKVGNSVRAGYNQLRNSTSKGLQSFRDSSTGFKVLSTLLIVLIIAIIIYWIVQAYKYKKRNNKLSPLLVKGVLDATKSNVSSIVPMPVDGLAQSYSMWIYIQSWEYKFGEVKYLLWKGSTSSKGQGGNIYGPTIALSPKQNDLMVLTSTTSPNSPEACNVQNIPLRKWVHIGYVLNNRNVDIYIDGKLERSCALQGVPKIVDKPVYVCPLGGFYGKIARVQYFAYPLNAQQITNIYTDGPLASVGYKISLFDDGKFVSVDKDVDNAMSSIHSDLTKWDDDLSSYFDGSSNSNSPSTSSPSTSSPSN